MVQKNLHLGSGPHVIPDWLNYDIGNHSGVIQLDLSRAQLPHDNDTVDFIFSEHAHEHFTKEQGDALLRECYRVLKPSGVIRISCPDLENLCESYISGRLIQMTGVWEPRTLCQMVNEAHRLWDHQYLYDFNELEASLKSAGFKYILRRQHHESPYTELCNREVRPYYDDLIVEAMK